MNTADIHISKIGSENLQELRALSIKTFCDSFGHENTEENMKHYINHFLSEEKLSAEIMNPASEFYFAWMDEAVIGYLKINVGKAQTELQDKNGLEIERIYVKKEWQGNKIGQLLFDKAMEIARKKAVDLLWLGVWEKNTGAIKFYERNGMIKFASHPFKLGDDIQTDIMMKISIGKW